MPFLNFLPQQVGELRELVPDDAVMEKLHFSCAADPAIRARVEGFGRPRVVLAGMQIPVNYGGPYTRAFAAVTPWTDHGRGPPMH